MVAVRVVDVEGACLKKTKRRRLVSVAVVGFRNKHVVTHDEPSFGGVVMSRLHGLRDFPGLKSQSILFQDFNVRRERPKALIEWNRTRYEREFSFLSRAGPETKFNTLCVPTRRGTQSSFSLQNILTSSWLKCPVSSVFLNRS